MTIYLDKTQPITARVEDLLAKMTLAEKCGQLNQRMYGWDAFSRDGDVFQITDNFKQEVARFEGIGALYGLFRADPWSKMNKETGISRVNSAKVANMVQRYVVENTRLGIPVLLAEEVPHGHQALDSESYPVNLARAASFHPELQQQVAEAIAEEISDKGVHLALASALDILRDPRWGRAEECYGEDPYLAAELTAAITEGFQKNGKIAVILKHFAAQGEPVGGHNSGPVSIGVRELREIFLEPLRAGIAKGALGVMAAYNEIDGVPCHANKELLTTILREEMGFEGIVMADGCALDRLLKLNPDPKKAAKMAIEAGVDLSLWDDVFPFLEESVTAGVLNESVVDQAVRRILQVKFQLGLFENPYVKEVVSAPSANWKKLNLQAAREGICLLKNEANTLPLKGKQKKLAIVGPNADALYNQLGDYTAPQNQADCVTVLEGLKSIVPKEWELIYEKGSEIREKVTDGILKAEELAEEADAIVLVLGGSSARNFNMEFLSNGAVSSKGPNMDAGENVDVADIALPEVQLELFRAMKRTNKPVIVVMIQGRPIAIPEISKEADALLTAWYPGSVGGTAVAEVLVGKYNPSGKLPVSIPVSSGQIPVYYNQKAVEYKEDYFDLTGKPLYPFGYGLSYSSFKYHDLVINQEHVDLSALLAGEKVDVTVTVENTSEVAGEEVVQLYIHDMESSITRRKKELKAFKKIRIEPKEKVEVTLELDKTTFEVWSINNKYEMETGGIQIFVGGSSDTTLVGQVTIVGG
ncbi:glycoside hydrolase family 3 N-terminal domain-containing protein [Listeria seeligeri]|uniref:glycoside hydrolase family 3 N-terminal domain-containing protein n=1 Tax=Listeria seeligeri TaxID=1640 RepID=UPI0016283C25|nr:glycoside hydrolase family 3 N-terminal domain-containing protein [Listeria seeligeri]MBC2069496.1 beta-glucosidase [Listeria seeligeri]MBC2088396.1 beta-glucosidase [Listeria seeligeri]MBF2353369.1 glycoside hydrolase family 3 C-terminal domain-containing protein [Listeria seeligeri]MBF2590769.1 glycoside hydrolase family 3 C-terminal domain-containing protein [Listeria seeligeri]MBF2651447.1 glycoside hydrolase family 3 C-terminal domain-containing protein [Listeria seeligeri]